MTIGLTIQSNNRVSYCDYSILSVSLELYDNYMEFGVKIMIIGYIKEGSKNCSLTKQFRELKDFGCEKIFEQEQSNTNPNKQSVYQNMKNELSIGDVLVVHDIMCFGKNKQEIKNEWESLIKEKIDVIILKKPVLDTRKCNESDNNQHVSKAVLSILSWMIDEEQGRIRSAQREGIEVAKRQGKFKGRKRKYHPEATGNDKAIYTVIINELNANTSVMDIHRKTGVARSTIYNIKTYSNK